MGVAADKVVVSGFAKALPERCVSNDELAAMMDTSDEWITSRTGIKTRYWAEPPIGASDLGAVSARRTLAAAGCEEVDAVIAATLSPDHYFPGIGVQIQQKLGLPHVPAYDVRNQCCGFLYGLEMGAALVAAGRYQRILLVGAELHSTALDKSTRGRDIAVLFGDGAGSCLISRAVEPQDRPQLEVLGTELHADGEHVQDLWCQHPGSRHYPCWLDDELVREARIFPRMNGRIVFEHAVKRMAEVSLSLLGKLGLQVGDLSLFVPHQANTRINEMVARRLGLGDEQVFNTIRRYGNTTAATIPIGLADAVAASRISPGAIVLSAAFGAGFTWGAAVMRAL